MSENISNYELKRKLNMEENERLLKELGLTDALLSKENTAADIPSLADTYNSHNKKKKRRVNYTPKRASEQLKPSRLSRRLRGETPEEYTDVTDILDDNDRVRQLDIANHNSSTTSTAASGATKMAATTTIDALPNDIHVPFTLRSIGTTIWELGTLCTGKGRSKAWSSRGCKFKHPYPVGYRATKSHFGNDYTMGILPPEKEHEGPIFQVQHKSMIWKGATPTAPWTEACLKSKSSSTRVSGPLFFGFSDPLTMKVIENMEGYQEACLPEDTAEEVPVDRRKDGSEAKSSSVSEITEEKEVERLVIDEGDIKKEGGGDKGNADTSGASTK